MSSNFENGKKAGDINKQENRTEVTHAGGTLADIRRHFTFQQLRKGKTNFPCDSCCSFVFATEWQIERKKSSRLDKKFPLQSHVSLIRTM